MRLLSSAGGIVNDITGVSNSAKQQQNAQMAMQKDAQEFAKWQMGNAHQQEVEDLKAAGLNPVLSAGGNGASAGVTEGSASTGISSGNPLEMIMGALNTAKQIEKNDAEIKNIEANTENTKTDTKIKGETNPLNQELIKSMTLLNHAQTAQSIQQARHDAINTATDYINYKIRGLDLENKHYDIAKRREIIAHEIVAAKMELEAEMETYGIQSDHIYRVLDAAAETVGKIWKGGHSTSKSINKSINKSTSKSEVGVKNLDYNPVRKQAIGF